MVRPVLKPTDVVNVTFDVELNSLSEVVSRNLSMCMTLYIRLYNASNLLLLTSLMTGPWPILSYHSMRFSQNPILYSQISNAWDTFLTVLASTNLSYLSFRVGWRREEEGGGGVLRLMDCVSLVQWLICSNCRQCPRAGRCEEDNSSKKNEWKNERRN